MVGYPHYMEMYTTNVEIPCYPFEVDPETGNPLFRINQYKSVISCKKAEFLTPHRKDYYFFALIKVGNSRHWIDTKPYTTRPNTLYFTVPHQIQLKEEAQPFSGISFSFSKDFLKLDNDHLPALPLIQNPHYGHELVLSEHDVLFVEDMLEKVLEEYHAQSHWQQNMLQSYIRVLLIYLSRLYQQQFQEEQTPPEQTMLKKFLTHIEASFRHTHEVSAYAELLNVSAGHLSELVKAQSGRSAIAHIHERITLEAKQLLFFTEYSAKEIAFELGFEDASYFNRFFKRATQQTPLQYRETVREMYH